MEVLAHVLMGLRHPLATVMLCPVLIMHMLALVTSTKSMLVLPVHVQDTGPAITATTFLIVRVTLIMKHVMSIKRTLDVLARALMGLNHPLASVIRIPVLTTYFLVLATCTRSTLGTVVPIFAMELYQTITAIPLPAPITCTTEHAMTTERTLEVLAIVLMGSDHPLATVILIPVLIMHTLVFAIGTKNTLVVRVRATELNCTITVTQILA